MAQQLKEMIDKWDYMKLKGFCTTKEMISKLKKLPKEWGKSLPSIHLQELITRKYRELKKTKLPKINDPKIE
jgi:hypothetical protein